MLAATVAIPSRDRPLRLRWLLNALEEQSVDPGCFEIVVSHDSADPAAERLLCTHPLAGAGRLRHVAFPSGSVVAGANRNAAWRLGRAPLVLFTDDDCRPERDWVERALAAARRHPGAILQGATRVDPGEGAAASAAPWPRTVHVAPPTPWVETCNVAYPRELLDRLGGFDEHIRVGEDTELAVRARRAGARIVAAPEMLVYHAVEDAPLIASLRSQRRWIDLPLLIKRYPILRRHLTAGVCWKPPHAALLAAGAGAVLSVRRPAMAALMIPWIRHALTYRGYGLGPRALTRSLSEMPGRAALDANEILVLACGSIRHRTLML